MKKKAPSRQIDKYAFTITGWACDIEHIDKSAKKLVAYMRSSMKLSSQLQKVKKIPIPNLQASEGELNEVEPGEGQEEYLWIGVALVVNGKLSTQGTKGPGGRKGKAIGTRRPLSKALRSSGDRAKGAGPQAETTQLVRVVVPLSDHIGAGDGDSDVTVTESVKVGTKKLDYYGLVGSVKGLCHAYKLKKDDIFFFAEFRDNSNSERRRQEQWPKIIKLAASGAGKASFKGNIGPRKPQPNFAPMALSEEQVLANTINQEVPALSLQPDEDRILATKFMTEAAQQCLLRKKPEMQHLQHEDFDDAFEKLLDIEYISMDHSLACGVVTKAETLWEVALDVDFVERVGQAMREARLRVSIQLLRPFIVIATNRMENEMQTGEKNSSDEEIDVSATDETPVLGALQIFHQDLEYLTKKLKANEDDADAVVGGVRPITHWLLDAY